MAYKNINTKATMKNQEHLNRAKRETERNTGYRQCGLYDAANEHDACGVGMIVNLHGGKSHELVDSALRVLENMKHRGAEGADNKTGDGAGIMVQIPHEFILLQGIPVPEKANTARGSSSCPKTPRNRNTS